MDKFKIGDWVEWDWVNVPPSNCDMSIAYQVRRVDESGDLLLSVSGDTYPNVSWPFGNWKISRKQTFNNILKELYESNS